MPSLPIDLTGKYIPPFDFDTQAWEGAYFSPVLDIKITNPSRIVIFGNYFLTGLPAPVQEDYKIEKDDREKIK